MDRTILWRAVPLLLSLTCVREKDEAYFPEPSHGSRWEYNVEYSTLAGVQRASMVVSIDGEEVLGGKEYYKQVAVVSGIPGVEPEITYGRWALEGVYVIDGKYKQMPEYLAVPFPVAVGSTWTAQAHTGTTTYRVAGIETLYLPGGKYDDCLKVSYESNAGGTHSVGTTYYAKGVGQVRLSTTVRGVTIEYTLTNHSR